MGHKQKKKSSCLPNTLGSTALGKGGRFGKYGELKRKLRLRQLYHDRTLPKGVGKTQVSDRRQRAYRRTPSTTLRKGTLRDKFFIGSLSKRVFSVFGDYVGTLLNWLSHPGVITVIVEQHNTPVAFAMLRLRKGFFNNSVGELLAIAVIPERQRQGIGGILLRHIESIVMTQGVSELRLNTAEINTQACHFFRKVGFNVVGIKDHFYPAGQPALEMCKKLNPSISG